MRPLIGRFSGALTEAETAALADRWPTSAATPGWPGRATVNAAVWPTCYDVLAPAARQAADRGLGLLYDSGLLRSGEWRVASGE